MFFDRELKEVYQLAVSEAVSAYTLHTKRL